MQADVFFYIKANIIHFLAKKNQRKVWTGSLILSFIWKIHVFHAESNSHGVLRNVSSTLFGKWSKLKHKTDFFGQSNYGLASKQLFEEWDL